MKPRNYSTDILRFIATLFVLFRHSSKYKNGGVNCKFLLFKILYTQSSACNLLFMLISSYYTSKSPYKVTKLIPMVLQCSTITALGYLATCFILEKSSFRPLEFSKHFFPCLNNLYWYPPAYLFGRLLDGFIQKSFSNVSQKFFLVMTIIFTVLFVLSRNGMLTFIFGIYYGTCPFIITCFIGGYIRYYPPNLSIIFYIVLYVIFSTSYIFAYDEAYHGKYSSVPVIGEIFKTLDKVNLFELHTICISTVLLIIFTKMHISGKIGKFISILAQHSFGIYLIHFTSGARGLWLDPAGKYSIKSPDYPIKLLKMVVKIFLPSFALDMIHSKLLNMFVFNRRYYKDLIEKIDNWISSE